MIARFVLALLVPLALGVVGTAHAQDVPGIEICTAEKTMERRTSCLQSNVEFLQKTITKLTLDHQQKLDAATRQIDSLKSGIATLQGTIRELQAAQTAMAEQLRARQDAQGGKNTEGANDAPK